MTLRTLRDLTYSEGIPTSRRCVCGDFSRPWLTLWTIPRKRRGISRTRPISTNASHPHRELLSHWSLKTLVMISNRD
jgi:hypothetical protein